MPSLSMSVAHALTQEEAAERLRHFLEKVKEQYGDRVSDLEEQWVECNLTYRFKAMGFSTSGTLFVEQEEVRLDSKIPMAAMMFRGTIESTIREQLERILS